MIPFYMLNVAFATVAFGQHVGITAAFLSVATLAQAAGDDRELSEWGLFLTVLLTLWPSWCASTACRRTPCSTP